MRSSVTRSQGGYDKANANANANANAKDLGNTSVSKKPHPTGHATIPARAAERRASRDGSIRPTSLAARAFKVLTTESFRAKLEFRHAARAADRALSDLMKAVRSRDESAVLSTSAKFQQTLSPLADMYSLRTSDVDVRGACLSRKIPTDDKLLASLNVALDALSDAALKDPVIGHLDFIVLAAMLNKQARAIEGDGLIFDVDGRTPLDVQESSMNRLQELMDMGERADALLQVSPDNQPLREKIPGTQLSPSRLQSMKVFGKAAEKEIAARTAHFNQLTSPKSDAIQKMPIKALMALSEKVVEGLEFPAWSQHRSQLLKLHWAISEQIRLQEDQIMKPIVGSIDTYDPTSQADQMLIAQRKAALDTPDTPRALVNASNRMRIEIAHRKDLSKGAFQRALIDALNKADASKVPDAVAGLVTETQKATTKFLNLNDKLDASRLTTWIDETRASHPTLFARRLKGLESALGAHNIPKDAADAQALALLKEVLLATPKPKPNPKQ